MEFCQSPTGCEYETVAFGQGDRITNYAIGIATADQDSTGLDDLMTRADQAMYSAKLTKGPAIAQFDSKMFEATKRERQIRDRLKVVISLLESPDTPPADHGVTVVFQPILDTRTGRLAHAETLIRWDDPVLGSIPPPRSSFPLPNTPD